MWNLENWYRWSYLQSTNREQTCGHQGGERQWEEQEDWSWPLHTTDTMYKPDNQGKHTVWHMELYRMHCADLNEEFQKEAEKYMCMAHSFHWTAETLESSYTPIKLNKTESPHCSNMKSKEQKSPSMVVIASMIFYYHSNIIKNKDKIKLIFTYISTLSHLITTQLIK